MVNLEFLSYKELEDKIHKDLERILAYPAIYPLESGDEYLSSVYGYRKDPFSNKYKFHEGHDYSARTGTSVIATANGRV